MLPVFVWCETWSVTTTENIYWGL